MSMSITITNRKGRQSIRATGKDAQVLFDAMCRSVGEPVAPKPIQSASNPVPNHPKDKSQGLGADLGLNGLQAEGAKTS